MTDNIKRDIGVALVNRYGNGITYSMTDEYMHFVGEVIVSDEGVTTFVDKYGSVISETNPVREWMLEGVTKYQAWSARHQ